MDNRIFLHIGYPKTGTTFLQNAFFPLLKEIHYVTQAELWSSGFISEVLLKDIFSYNHIVVDKLLRKWKVKAGSKPLFISYEGFVGNILKGGSNLPLITERLKATGFDFKILMTIRNQPNIIDSLYIQYVHQGGSLSFNNFIRLEEKNPIYLPFSLFNFNKMYAYWNEQFGQKNISVIPYESLKDKNDFIGLLEDFFECSLSFVEQEVKTNHNVSLSGWRFQFLLFANRFLSSWITPNAVIPSRLMNSKKIKNYLQKGCKPRKDSYFLNTKECEKYINSYKIANKELSKKIDIPLQEKYNYL